VSLDNIQLKEGKYYFYNFFMQKLGTHWSINNQLLLEPALFRVGYGTVRQSNENQDALRAFNVQKMNCKNILIMCRKIKINSILSYNESYNAIKSQGWERLRDKASPINFFLTKHLCFEDIRREHLTSWDLLEKQTSLGIHLTSIFTSFTHTMNILLSISSQT
jgi:hypothetical protein